MPEALETPNRPQRFNTWLAHKHPRLWGRYWGARLMATTYYSQQLDAQSPDIVGWMSVKRHALGLLIMVLPMRLPVRPELSPAPNASNTENL